MAGSNNIAYQPVRCSPTPRLQSCRRDSGQSNDTNTTSSRSCSCAKSPYRCFLSQSLRVPTTTFSSNRYREMCGLDNVTTDATMNADTQSGALIISATGILTHTPADTSLCWTQVRLTHSLEVESRLLALFEWDVVFTKTDHTSSDLSLEPPTPSPHPRTRTYAPLRSLRIDDACVGWRHFEWPVQHCRGIVRPVVH